MGAGDEDKMDEIVEKLTKDKSNEELKEINETIKEIICSILGSVRIFGKFSDPSMFVKGGNPDDEDVIYKIKDDKILTIDAHQKCKQYDDKRCNAFNRIDGESKFVYKGFDKIFKTTESIGADASFNTILDI